MDRQEILAVTEADREGCETIKKLVHEKLGLCWHDWLVGTYHGSCKKCGSSRYTFDNELVKNPDYTHDIKAAWAIKEWLDEHDLKSCHTDSVKNAISGQSGLTIVFQYELLWASPLDRCKAFLLMESAK